ncbi:hypothetical protein Vretimale_19183, partial [Volvox reticuliferus]
VGGGSGGSGSVAAHTTGQSTGNGGAAAGDPQRPIYSGSGGGSGQSAADAAGAAAAASVGGVAAHGVKMMTPASNTHQDGQEHRQQPPPPQIEPQQQNPEVHPVASVDRFTLPGPGIIAFTTASTAMTPMAKDNPRTGGGGSEYGGQHSRAGTEVTGTAAAAAEEEDEEDVVMRSGFGAAWRSSGSGSVRRRRAVVLDGSEEQDIMELPPPPLPLPSLGTPKASPDVQPLVQPSANGRTEPTGSDKISERSPACQHDQQHPTHGSAGGREAVPMEIDRRKAGRDGASDTAATAGKAVSKQGGESTGTNTTVRGVGEGENDTSRGGSRTRPLDVTDDFGHAQQPQQPPQPEEPQQQGAEGADHVLRNLRHEAASLRDALQALRARRMQPQTAAAAAVAAATTAAATTVMPRRPDGATVAIDLEGAGEQKEQLSPLLPAGQQELQIQLQRLESQQEQLERGKGREDSQLLPEEATEAELQRRLKEVESRVRRAERALKQMKPWDWDELKDVHPPNVDKLAPAETKRQRRVPTHYSPAKVYAEAQVLRARATRGSAAAAVADGDGWERYDAATLSPVAQNPKLPDIGGRGGHIGNCTGDVRSGGGSKRGGGDGADSRADGSSGRLRKRPPAKRRRQSAASGGPSKTGSRGSNDSRSSSSSSSSDMEGASSSSDEDLPIGCIAAAAANKDGCAGAAKHIADKAATSPIHDLLNPPRSAAQQNPLPIRRENPDPGEPQAANPVPGNPPVKHKVLVLDAAPTASHTQNPEDHSAVAEVAEDLATAGGVHNGPPYPGPAVAVPKAATEAAAAAASAGVLRSPVTGSAVEAAAVATGTATAAAVGATGRTSGLPGIAATAVAVIVTPPTIGSSAVSCDQVPPLLIEQGAEGNGAVSSGSSNPSGSGAGEPSAWRRSSVAPLTFTQPPSCEPPSTELPLEHGSMPPSDIAATVAAAAIRGQSAPDLFAEIRQMSAWMPLELMGAAALSGGDCRGGSLTLAEGLIRSLTLPPTAETTISPMEADGAARVTAAAVTSSVPGGGNGGDVA